MSELRERKLKEEIRRLHRLCRELEAENRLLKELRAKDATSGPPPKGPAGDAGQVGWLGGEHDR